MSEWVKDAAALFVLGAVMWSGFALTAAAQAAG